MYWNEYKAKSENKNTTDEYRYFVESNFVGVYKLFVLIYSKTKKSMLKDLKPDIRYYLPKGVIKNYHVIINGKNFHDQPVDSDIKRYEEINRVINKTSWRFQHLKKLDANGNATGSGNEQCMFVLTILERIKERGQTCFQGSVTVLWKMANFQEIRAKLTNAQLNKLKYPARNHAGTTLKITRKNFQDFKTFKNYHMNYS